MITTATRPYIRFELLLPLLASALLLTLSACGGDSDGANPTATPTTQPTTVATPTTQPTATRTPIEGAVVSGLVVVNQSISGTTNDRLGVPPAAWMDDASNIAFDRALGLADWVVAEDTEISGTTEADGQFVIGGLPAGRYTLLVTKTLDGNLLTARVPFTAGDMGATVVAEVSWGLVRSVSTYLDDGAEVREVRDPSGRWLVTRDGQIAELGDGSITLSDPDGDGSFDVVPCVDTLWACGNDGCGDDRVCGCVSSCPFCEDCGATACQPAGLFPNAYRCNDDDTCQQPGDRCVCVSSCPDCDDCPFSACVSDCQSVTITAVTINGPSELIVSEQRSMYAVATLSNNRSLDVTTLVEWTSSDTTIASVDAFGTVDALAIGTTTLRATLGDVASSDWPLSVVARPALQRIYLQNVNCYYPLGDPRVFPGDQTAAPTAPPIRDDLWWPWCNQVLRIGGTIQFRATGEFGSGSYYQDITDEVTWQLAPAGIGSIAGGLFTAQAEGTTTLTASLDGITSDGSEIRVVTEATVTMVSIYADQGVPIAITEPGVVFPDGAAAGGRPDPCFECGYTIPILRGDELHFHATAHYDTGEWQDVTDDVTWRSSDANVAPIDAQGTMTALSVGTAVIDATFEETTSNPVTARVVSEATLQYIFLQAEGTDRVVVKGGQLFFHALGSYDLGFQRDITDEVTWRSSDANVASIDAEGTMTAFTVGTVQVWAESGELSSDPISLEVYETSDITYCDAANVNRNVWSDDFNRVTLESDCDQYTRPGVVELRYTVTETQLHGGIFDPCLDLYIYQGTEKIRTLREEGCGEPFLARGAPEFDAAVLKYQLRAFWDLKDEAGQTVSAGTYTVFGRFYLYYDPVVSIEVEVD